MPAFGRLFLTDRGSGRGNLVYRRYDANLAEANGVPVSTVHRWVKEARRRGFLPPGRPGRSG